jgi:hypothetical protein
VWGSPESANRAIILDHLGKAAGWIPLTKNLSNALCDLRGAKELKSEFFWIDQICINQQDDEEKNKQVAMMSQIYTQARQVITYLGPIGIVNEEKRGMRLLNRIGSNMSDSWQRMHEAGSIERIRDWIHDDFLQLQQLPLDLNLTTEEQYEENDIFRRYINQGWDWLIKVAYGEWTHRLWIVQEQVLNKEIIALRGHCLIDWDSIVTIPMLLAIGHLPQPYRDIGRRRLGEHALRFDEVERTTYGIWWDRHARLEYEADYSWPSLCHNLQWYQPLLCRDARDRVYAILAISEDSATLGLNADYSVLNTVDVLSKELSTRVLANGINLEFLSFGLSWRRPDSTLPSWCLDLECTVGANSPVDVPAEVYKPHPTSLLIHPPRFHTDNSILVVKGRILDCASAINPSVAWVSDATSNSLQANFLSELLHTEPDGFSLSDVACILRTVTARAPWSPPSVANVSEIDATAFHFWTYLRHLLRVLSENSSILPLAAERLFECCHRILESIKALAPHNAYPESQVTDEIHREENLALEKVLHYSLEEGRCLGRTSAGRFFNAIHTIQEGDAIVALQGADRLYAIRLVGSTYRLIGDVYADGCMHGEAYKDVDPDAVDYDIELS